MRNLSRASRNLRGVPLGRCVSFVIVSLLAASASATGSNPIADWNALAANTVNATGYPAVTPEEMRPQYQLDLATVNVAMYDAVTAIAGRYRPFAIEPTSPTRGASVDAAAGAAACRVLQALFPSRTTVYSAACAAFQLSSPGTPAQLRGVVIGVEVAEGVIALRANDGRSTQATYTSTGAPGNFVPFPATSTPANVFGPYVKPFTLTGASQFRSYGPPGLGSAAFARNLNEVRAFGGTVSTQRTADQEELARFATEPPPFFWPRNLRRFASTDRSVLENVRLQAMLWVAQADAIIGCFEAKYAYAFWRPRTAIPAGDTAGNPAIASDPTWTPFLPTPNHPEYPAAHGCAAAAAGEVLSAYFGTRRIDFDVDSSVTGTTRHYESTTAFVRDMRLARVYGGMHYPVSTVHGAALGKAVAEWVVKNHFRPIKEWSHN
jgi:hypothetical protein